MRRSADHDTCRQPVASASLGGSSVRLLAPVSDRPLGPVGGLRPVAEVGSRLDTPALTGPNLLCSCGSHATKVCGDCHRPACAHCGGVTASRCWSCRGSPTDGSKEPGPRPGPVPGTAQRIFDLFFAAMEAAGFPGTSGFYDPTGIEPTGRQRRRLQKAVAKDNARRISGARLTGNKQAAEVLWAQIAERACGRRPTHHGWFVGTLRAEAPAGGSLDASRSAPASLVLLTDRSFALCQAVDLKLLQPAPAGDHRSACVMALIRTAADQNITLLSP